MKPVLSLIVAVVVGLSVAPPANAAYYINKPMAEHYLRRLLHSYGYTGTGTYCRPNRGVNESAVKSGHVLWHRWACGFYTGEPGDACKGAISIVGHDGGAGFLYHRNGSVGEAC